MTMLLVVAVMVAISTPVAVFLGRSLPGHHRLLVVRDGLHVAVLRGRSVPHGYGRLIARSRLLVIRRGVGVGRWHRTVALLRVPLVGDTRTDQTSRTCAQDGAVTASHGLANGSACHCADSGTQEGVHIVCMGRWGYTRQSASQQHKGSQGAQSGCLGFGQRGQKMRNTRSVHGVGWD